MALTQPLIPATPLPLPLNGEWDTQETEFDTRGQDEDIERQGEGSWISGGLQDSKCLHVCWADVWLSLNTGRGMTLQGLRVRMPLGLGKTAQSPHDSWAVAKAEISGCNDTCRRTVAGIFQMRRGLQMWTVLGMKLTGGQPPRVGAPASFPSSVGAKPQDEVGGAPRLPRAGFSLWTLRPLASGRSSEPPRETSGLWEWRGLCTP